MGERGKRSEQVYTLILPRQADSLLTFARFSHYTVPIEGLDIHFIHEKSKSSDPIPLLLLHGWPGSFLEFAPIIEELTQQVRINSGKTVSFDIIVPSIPGFAFSSVPPVNWTIADTARVFNTLLTKVLYYETYAVFGTDWGAGIAYTLYDQYNTTVRAGHLAFLPFFPLDQAGLASQNITLSPLEQFEELETVEWNSYGEGYFIEQTTKVFYIIQSKVILNLLTILSKTQSPTRSV